jgi:signal transduction histidine kinase/iron only hydrogenase large subunit-like protein
MNATPEVEGPDAVGASVIHTVLGKCRRCFTCVRACPAKAIRIEQGQARVVAERCIACGNCVVVCAQHAKAYRSGVEGALGLLHGDRPVAALVAPSFPAEFSEGDAARLVGALRRSGFARVVEVAHGADLVSEAYQQEMATERTGPRIASACPAVVEYIRKYAPHLVDKLVAVVSPMIAAARSVHALYGEDVRCVFIGPCVAKKREALDPEVAGEIDEVLTFRELRDLLAQLDVSLGQCERSDFDPPRAGQGRLFPMVGGLLKATGHERNLLHPEAIVLSGHQETLEVLSKLSGDEPFASFIEPLMCRGCYSGPGMSTTRQRLDRKQAVAAYVREGAQHDSEATPPVGLPRVPLSRRFVEDDRRLPEPPEAEIRRILARTNKFAPSDELNCGACGYATCREKAVAVHHGLAEEAMCLPFMVEAAERVCQELKLPWLELREVQGHLVNTEKLASLGQMAAGIAHELNNPLGTILLYTGIVRRKLDGREDLHHDLDLLSDESQRCKRIIGSLLDFARQNRVKLERVQVLRLLQDVVEETSFANRDPHVKAVVVAPEDLEVDVDRDQMRQVLDNLFKNAVEAMEGRDGSVTLRAVDLEKEGHVRLSVTDEGCGIPQEARDKIFQPFFTTKRIGRGTGLGLPISYGIVKMHHGRIWVESEPGAGTTVFIELPRQRTAATRSVIE